MGLVRCVKCFLSVYGPKTGWKFSFLVKKLMAWIFSDPLIS